MLREGKFEVVNLGRLQFCALVWVENGDLRSRVNSFSLTLMGTVSYIPLDSFAAQREQDL